MAVYANWIASECKGTQSHSICVFGVQDLSYLVTRRELFANKFFATFEPLALDCMRAWIEHKEICPVTFDLEYYRGLKRVVERTGKRFAR